MQTLRWGTMLLLVGLIAALVTGCGDDGRSEEILECALPCNSDGDCPVGQTCVPNDDDASDGCCDRFYDRALVDTDADLLSGTVVTTDIAALNRMVSGSSDVDGSWRRSKEQIGFYDGGAAYRDSTSPIGDALVLLINSKPGTDNGDRELLKVYVKFSAFKAGDKIDLDGANGMAEYFHNVYNTNETTGKVASLNTSELLGVSYAYGDEMGTVVVDARGRAASLLPPVQVTLLRQSDVYFCLDDFLAAMGREVETWRSLGSSTVMITGPSKTGDIESQLVLGVHGPGRVEVVLLES